MDRPATYGLSPFQNIWEAGPFDLTDPRFGGWALLEIMGHRSHVGFVRELEVFGVKMVEVLVPFANRDGIEKTHLYAGSAVFSLTPRSREECVDSLRPHVVPQLASWSDDEQSEDEPEGQEDPGTPAGDDLGPLF